MNTLVELAKLSTDSMKKGIINTIVYESPFAARLPFVDILGNSLLYNLESTLAGANWYTTGDTWAESAPTWAQRSVALTILGGDCDVDSFAEQTRSNVQDLKRAVIEKKSKAIANEFEKQCVLGQTTTQTSTKQLIGLMKHIAMCESSTTTDWDAPNNGQLQVVHADSGALTLAFLEELVDLVRPGKPDVLLMSRRARRKIDVLARAAGTNLVHDKDQLGFMVASYGGIPILISDHIPDNLQDGSSSIVDIAAYNPATTRASGYDNTAIFAVKLGEDHLFGVSNGGIQTEDLGKLETKDATRTRIKWYCGMGMTSTPSIAALFNINPDS